MKRFLALCVSFAIVVTLGVSVYAAVEDTGFSDVAANEWYADAVEYVRDNGLMCGTSDTTFAPDGTMTRAMLAAVLYRLAGSPPVTGRDSFTDTEDNAWYSDAVLWASQRGLVSGYGSGLFGTNDPVSREQIAAILWRYAGSPTAERGSDFADESSIASYAADAVDWARANGIISGTTGNRFSPQSSATRAQVAVILRNYVQLGEDNRPNPPAEPEAPDSHESRILIAYFTRANNVEYDGSVDAVSRASLVVDRDEIVGNNGIIAQYIQEEVGGDLFSIETVTPYPLNYDDNVSVANAEQRTSARPALKTSVDHFEDYDIVFLGTPNWWGDMPMPMYTFLEQYDFSGKTIIPFNTHRGSSFNSIVSTIARLEPNATVVRDAFSVWGDDLNQYRQDVTDWVADLDVLN